MHREARRLLVLVTLAFLAIVAGWVVMFVLAARNAPEPIPLPPPAGGRP